MYFMFQRLTGIMCNMELIIFKVVVAVTSGQNILFCIPVKHIIPSFLPLPPLPFPPLPSHPFSLPSAPLSLCTVSLSPFPVLKPNYQNLPNEFYK